MKRVVMRGFKPDSDGLRQVLGALEASVMQLLWETSPQTVTEVESRLQHTRQIAHTTVQTTLDRMHRKGYLTRTKEGKAFLYAPRWSRAEFEQHLTHEVLDALLEGFGEPALSAFVDLVGMDVERLDRLEAMIRRKRREQGTGGPPP